MTTITFEGGGEGEVTGIEGSRLRATANRAFPPGSRHRAAVGKVSFRIKVERCVGATMPPAPDGEPAEPIEERYALTLRLIDVKKEDREAIERAFRGE